MEPSLLADFTLAKGSPMATRAEVLTNESGFAGVLGGECCVMSSVGCSSPVTP